MKTTQFGSLRDYDKFRINRGGAVAIKVPDTRVPLYDRKNNETGLTAVCNARWYLRERGYFVLPAEYPVYKLEVVGWTLYTLKGKSVRPVVSFPASLVTDTDAEYIGGDKVAEALNQLIDYILDYVYTGASMGQVADLVHGKVITTALGRGYYIQAIRG